MIERTIKAQLLRLAGYFPVVTLLGPRQSGKTTFEIFIKLLAGRIGQIVSLSSMAGDVGVSGTTLNSWLSVLEASYIVFRLPCYFENFGKRQIKSPKIYFTDVGLAAYLLGIENPAQAVRDPLFGGLFENMVVMEALKARCNQGREPELYYFRDHLRWRHGAGGARHQIRQFPGCRKHHCRCRPVGCPRTALRDGALGMMVPKAEIIL